jgi:alpha-tubulin suppressor-like RCC1 family protein
MWKMLEEDVSEMDQRHETTVVRECSRKWPRRAVPHLGSAEQLTTRDPCPMSLSLWDCAEDNDVEGIQAILFDGFPPREASPFDSTSLGSPLDERDGSGKTPLMTAACCGCMEAASVLLARPGAAHQVDFESGWTALHHAVYRGNWGAACALLGNGASAFASDAEGWSSLDLASRSPACSAALSLALVHTQAFSALHKLHLSGSMHFVQSLAQHAPRTLTFLHSFPSLLPMNPFVPPDPSTSPLAQALSMASSSPSWPAVSSVSRRRLTASSESLTEMAGRFPCSRDPHPSLTTACLALLSVTGGASSWPAVARSLADPSILDDSAPSLTSALDALSELPTDPSPVATSVLVCGHHAGDLGSSSHARSLSPRPVPRLFGSGAPLIAKVASGPHHSLALDSTGAVYCWGSGSHGRLGSGSTDPWLDPSRLACTFGDSPAIDVACGLAFSLVLTADGGVWAFGENSFGQCGVVPPPPKSSGRDGRPRQLLTPRRLDTGALRRGRAVSIAAGNTFGVAVLTDGAVVVWGDDRRWTCQGLPHCAPDQPIVLPPACMPTPWTTLSTKRASRGEGESRAVQVSACADHALCVTSDGQVWCWGNGVRDVYRVLFQPHGHQPMARKVAGGRSSRTGLCNSTADAASALQVRNQFLAQGQLPPHDVASSRLCHPSSVRPQRKSSDSTHRKSPLKAARSSDPVVPAMALGLGEAANTLTTVSPFVFVTDASAGAGICAACDTAGTLWTWPPHSDGVTPNATPESTLVLLGEHVSQVAAGDAHVLALTASGCVFGLGKGSSGELGVGKPLSEASGAVLMPNVRRAISVSAASSHSFVVTALTSPPPLHTPVPSEEELVAECEDAAIAWMGFGAWEAKHALSPAVSAPCLPVGSASREWSGGLSPSLTWSPSAPEPSAPLRSWSDVTGPGVTRGIPSLRNLASSSLASSIDVSTIVPLLQVASLTQSRFLGSLCAFWLDCNADLVLALLDPTSGGGWDRAKREDLVRSVGPIVSGVWLEPHELMRLIEERAARRKAALDAPAVHPDEHLSSLLFSWPDGPDVPRWETAPSPSLASQAADPVSHLPPPLGMSFPSARAEEEAVSASVARWAPQSATSPSPTQATDLVNAWLDPSAVSPPLDSLQRALGMLLRRQLGLARRLLDAGQLALDAVRATLAEAARHGGYITAPSGDTPGLAALRGLSKSQVKSVRNRWELCRDVELGLALLERVAIHPVHELDALLLSGLAATICLCRRIPANGLSLSSFSTDASSPVPSPQQLWDLDAAVTANDASIVLGCAFLDSWKATALPPSKRMASRRSPNRQAASGAPLASASESAPLLNATRLEDVHAVENKEEAAAPTVALPKPSRATPALGSIIEATRARSSRPKNKASKPPPSPSLSWAHQPHSPPLPPSSASSFESIMAAAKASPVKTVQHTGAWRATSLAAPGSFAEVLTAQTAADLHRQEVEAHEKAVREARKGRKSRGKPRHSP